MFKVNATAQRTIHCFQVSHSPNLVMVTQDAFMANTALERVEITDNPKLEEISIDSFSHLHNLKHLSLNNNSLLVSLL
jgi:hypothetical protein